MQKFLLVVSFSRPMFLLFLKIASLASPESLQMPFLQ